MKTKTNPENSDRPLLLVVLIQLIPSLAIVGATNALLAILVLSSIFSALVGGLATRQIEGEGRFIVTTPFVVMGFLAVFFVKNGDIPSIWIQVSIVVGATLLCGVFKYRKTQQSASSANSS